MFGATKFVFNDQFACWLNAISQSIETGKEHVVCQRVVQEDKSTNFRICEKGDLKEAARHGYLPCVYEGPVKLVPMEGGMAVVI